jgi:predicted tellurium resistance membrane protein TerC
VRAVRIALWVFVGFIAGSLVTGGLEGTDFETNLSYGLKTGVVAAVVVGLVAWAIFAKKAKSDGTDDG